MAVGSRKPATLNLASSSKLRKKSPAPNLETNPQHGQAKEQYGTIEKAMSADSLAQEELACRAIVADVVSLNTAARPPSTGIVSESLRHWKSEFFGVGFEMCVTV